MNKQNQYQIVENYGNYMHAGSKATNDVADILTKVGFQSLEFINYQHQTSIFSKLLRQLKFIKQWIKIANTIPDNSTIVLQHPFHVKHFCRFRILKQLKQKKKIKIISIVHDVEELRGLFTKTYYSVEFNQMIALADSLIVHNEVMLDWFVSKGIEKTKLVNLEIFDYLNDKILKPNRDISKKIIIAGNLSKTKSPYIYMLKELKDIEVDLFGINYEQSFESENITYKGAFPAEQVPFELNEGLGLVWDGDKLDECSGATGNYLRYNNPHKLSLYLSSGRPVIVWSKSAEAKFVEENNIGFAVDSLFDIEKKLRSISNEELINLESNAINIGKKLQNGTFLTKALKKSLEM